MSVAGHEVLEAGTGLDVGLLFIDDEMLPIIINIAEVCAVRWFYPSMRRDLGQDKYLLLLASNVLDAFKLILSVVFEILWIQW